MSDKSDMQFRNTTPATVFKMSWEWRENEDEGIDLVNEIMVITLGGEIG